MRKKSRTIALMCMSMCMGLGAMTGHAQSLTEEGFSQVYPGADGSYYAQASFSVPVIPVYMFYSAYMRDYFWTTSEYEADELSRKYAEGTETYQYYGVDGYAQGTSDDWNTPVYRFWNEKTSDHFYTTSEAEKEQLEENLAAGEDDYEYEGIAWYAPKYSGKPVYRFFDILSYDHYYTSSESERERLTTEYYNGTGTFRYEGVAWYWFE